MATSYSKWAFISKTLLEQLLYSPSELYLAKTSGQSQFLITHPLANMWYICSFFFFTCRHTSWESHVCSENECLGRTPHRWLCLYSFSLPDIKCPSAQSAVFSLPFPPAALTSSGDLIQCMIYRSSKCGWPKHGWLWLHKTCLRSLPYPLWTLNTYF